MVKHAPVDGVEWVVDDDEAPIASDDQRPRIPPPAVALFVILCIGAAGLGLFTLSSHERVQAPTPAPTAVPTPTLDLDALDDPRVLARFDATLATLPDLTLVLPRLDGTTALRIATGNNTFVDATTFDAAHSLAVDSSGQWVAGLVGRATGTGATLWAGPADGELVEVASGVIGFAWHETEPAQLAFSADETLQAIDMGQPDTTPAQLASSSHHLERWGSWGFVVRPVLTGTGFHVLSPTGGEVATGYQGSVVGSLNQRLIVNLAGGRRSPLFVFADTGQAWPVFALTDTQLARGVAAGGTGEAVALHVSNAETDTHEIRIFPGDSQPPTIIPVAEATGALTWSHDRSTLFYLSQNTSGATELLAYDFTTDELVATPVGSSPNVNHWQSAIAIGREETDPPAS